MKSKGQSEAGKKEDFIHVKIALSYLKLVNSSLCKIYQIISKFIQ